MISLPWTWVERMQSNFGRKIRCVSFGLRLEKTEMLTGSVYKNPSHPSIFLFAEVSSKRSIFRRSVLLIKRVSSFSKVAYPVISRVSIYVVNMCRRPLSVNIKPSEAVNFVFLPVNHNLDVALFIGAVKNISFSNSGVSDKPCENSGIRVVMEKFANFFYGKIDGSHSVVPLKQLIGQEPRSVSALSGLRHFNMAG